MSTCPLAVGSARVANQSPLSLRHLQDLRLGGTATSTPLRQLLGHHPCLRTAILDVGPAAAPDWWSARQVRPDLRTVLCVRGTLGGHWQGLLSRVRSAFGPSAAALPGCHSLRAPCKAPSRLAHATGPRAPPSIPPQLSALRELRCLRSLQIDGGAFEPPKASKASRAGKGGTAAAGSGSAAAAGPSGASRADGGSHPVEADSDDESEAFLSAGTGDERSGDDDDEPGWENESAFERDPLESDSDGSAQGGGGLGARARGKEVLRAVAAVAALQQLTELTLSFDGPTLYHTRRSPGGPGEGGGSLQEEEESASEDEDDEDDGGAARGRAQLGRAGGAGAAGGRAAARALRHARRVARCLVAAQSLSSLGALQGLWRLRVGLPRGDVWSELEGQMLPALRLALPRATVELDVL